MKVLLLQPSIKRNKVLYMGIMEPLALVLIGTYIKDYCDVEIIDLRFEKEPLEKILARVKPDIVGVSCYTAEVPTVQKILEDIKAFDKNIVTVVGGPHPTAMPDDFFRPWVDVIIRGMGEAAFKELVTACSSNKDLTEIKGVVLPNPVPFYTEPGEIPDNLDHLPVPDRTLISKYLKKYKQLGKKIVLLHTAKGCTERCNFCSIWTDMKGKYIVRSPENVFRDIQSVPDKFIRFADGNTFADIERMERLYSLIKASGIKKKFMADIRSDTIVKYPDIVRKWAEIGLKYVIIGLEAVTDSGLEQLNKSNSVDNNRKAVKILRDNGIMVFGQFIIDHDFEEEDFDNIVKFVGDNRIDIPGFSVLTPLPGTILYQKVKDKLLTRNFEHFDFFHSVLPTKLDSKRFFELYFSLFKRTYSVRRIFNGLKLQVYLYAHYVMYIRYKHMKQNFAPVSTEKVIANIK